MCNFIIKTKSKFKFQNIKPCYLVYGQIQMGRRPKTGVCVCVCDWAFKSQGSI